LKFTLILTFTTENLKKLKNYEVVEGAGEVKIEIIGDEVIDGAIVSFFECSNSCSTSCRGRPLGGHQANREAGRRLPTPGGWSVLLHWQVELIKWRQTLVADSPLTFRSEISSSPKKG